MPTSPNIVFDAALSGNITTRSGRAIIRALERDGVRVVTSEHQRVLVQNENKVFPLTLKTDRALDDLVLLVRSHTPSDVTANFSVSLIADGVCRSLARVCKEPLHGLRKSPSSNL